MAFPVPVPERCRDGLGGDGPMPSNRAGSSRGAAASAGAISGSRAARTRQPSNIDRSAQEQYHMVSQVARLRHEVLCEASSEV